MPGSREEDASNIIARQQRSPALVLGRKAALGLAPTLLPLCWARPLLPRTVGGVGWNVRISRDLDCGGTDGCCPALPCHGLQQRLGQPSSAHGLRTTVAGRFRGAADRFLSKPARDAQSHPDYRSLLRGRHGGRHTWAGSLGGPGALQNCNHAPKCAEGDGPAIDCRRRAPGHGRSQSCR